MTQTEIRPLATVDEFCTYAGVTRGQAAQLRYTGGGPVFIKITGRQVRYRWSDIEEWVESRTRTRTDDPGTVPDYAEPKKAKRMNGAVRTCQTHAPAPAHTDDPRGAA
jgi:predicted DNA-binding transcriptional regulator AlpA